MSIVKDKILKIKLIKMEELEKSINLVFWNFEKQEGLKIKIDNNKENFNWTEILYIINQALDETNSYRLPFKYYNSINEIL